MIQQRDNSAVAVHDEPNTPRGEQQTGPRAVSHTGWGMTRYDVGEGYVYELIERTDRYNEGLGKAVPHRCFLWVMRIKRPRKGQLRKKRKVKVFHILVPECEHSDKDLQYGRLRWIQYDTLISILAPGCRITTKDCIYHYTRASWKRFYRCIGIL